MFPRSHFDSPQIGSSKLSIEAIVGIVAVVVAVLGIALPFLWPSFKGRRLPVLSRRPHPSSTSHLDIPLANSPSRFTIPPPSIKSRVADSTISRPQYVRFDHREQQRVLVRRTLTF
ncbi:hypothetical protein ACET3X_009420 [Alternaria dauci]|uniref:Uncharacterized protein n=1 Tax=Alternaria dauci TaxID=48095 RepID=A0ABR3UAB7_9PLEO